MNGYLPSSIDLPIRPWTKLWKVFSLSDDEKLKKHQDWIMAGW